MISTLEILLLIVGTVVLVSLLYSAYWSFSIAKVLYGKIYRIRALWTGLFAAYSAIEIGVIVYLPNFLGTDTVNLVWLVLGSALLFILTAWVSSTINVVVALDPFHRNRLKWHELGKIVWIISGIIVFMNLIPGSVFLDWVQSGLIIAFFVYLLSVILAYQTVIYNSLLKAYLKSFFYLLIVLMLSIALFPVALTFGLFIGPFALTDSLLIISAFFMFKMSKSLAPVTTKLTFQKGPLE